MSASRIDGKALAQKVRDSLKAEAALVARKRGHPVGLAVVRVGEDPASKVYVGAKQKAALELGFGSWEHHLPADVTQAQLLAKVLELNADPKVDGILVQLPLPRHLDASEVLFTVDPMKDVDGFHPMNTGLLFQGRPGLVACTPAGVMKLLEEIEFNPSGKVAVVVGRSNIVGRPMAALLINASATVVVCHSKSNVEAEVRRADLVVAAVGVPGLVKGGWIKEGAVVIDVGMNRLPDGKLTGDVEFGPASERAAHITPVPGGVGPMTVAMLMHNTVQSALARLAVG